VKISKDCDIERMFWWQNFLNPKHVLAMMDKPLWIWKVGDWRLASYIINFRGDNLSVLIGLPILNFSKIHNT